MQSLSIQGRDSSPPAGRAGLPMVSQNDRFQQSVAVVIIELLSWEFMENTKSEKMIDEIKTAIIILNGYIKYLKNRKEHE